MQQRIDVNYDCDRIMFWTILNYYGFNIPIKSVWHFTVSNAASYGLVTRWENLYMNNSITDSMRLQMTKDFIVQSINRNHSIAAAEGAAKGVQGNGHAFVITGYNDCGNIVTVHMWSGQPHESIDLHTLVVTYNLIEMWEVYPQSDQSVPEFPQITPILIIALMTVLVTRKRAHARRLRID